jgi:hypothetical protein
VPCFGDQPLLGIDAQNIYISTNEFSINGPQFNGAQLYVIDKRQLVDGDASPTFVHFGPLRIGRHKAASVQPAITVGFSRAEYLMSSLDPNGTGDNRIGVWAVTNRVLGSHPDPHLQRIIIPSQSYAGPRATPQMGSKSLIDSGDDRMQQVVFANGNLWTAVPTKVQPGGQGPVRAGAAWFILSPSMSSGQLSASVVNEGYVSIQSANSVLFPAVAGDVANAPWASPCPDRACSQRRLRDARQVRPTSGRRSSPARGRGPYFRKSTRWGDHSWAVLYPAAHRVWLANEYIPPRASQTVDGHQNWGTRVYAVRLPSP